MFCICLLFIYLYNNVSGVKMLLQRKVSKKKEETMGIAVQVKSSSKKDSCNIIFLFTDIY